MQATTIPQSARRSCCNDPRGCAQSGGFFRGHELRQPAAQALPRFQGTPGTAKRAIRMLQAVESDAPSVNPGPGRLLAQLRAERKLSVGDVAQRLKYGVRQIEALEAEEFDKLPGATFVRGMVRGYAKLLETDPEPVLGALDERYIPEEVDLDLRDKGIPFARTGKRGTRTYLALSVVALLVVAGVLYEWRAGAFPWARFESSTPAPQAQSKAPPVIPPPPPPAPIEVGAAPPLSAVETPPPAGQHPPAGRGGGVGEA